MYLVREILHCKPGKAGEMVKKFKALGATMKKMGFKPFRLMTDISGERFWTVIAETEADSLDAFSKMEEKVMASDEARAAMSGYHELIEEGRRELYKVEV